MRPLWRVFARVSEGELQLGEGATQQCKFSAYMMCMTVWVACAHVCIWIQVSGGVASHDNDKPTVQVLQSHVHKETHSMNTAKRRWIGPRSLLLRHPSSILNLVGQRHLYMIGCTT